MRAMILIFAFANILALCQDQPPPPSFDPAIQALIDKVENREKKGVESKFNPEGALQEEVFKNVNQFFISYLEEDFENSYKMMAAGYKKYVTFAKYVGKDRLDLERVLITNMIFPSNECTIVTGYMWGNQSSLGSTIKVPFREIFFREEGEWKLFKNPFTNAMGVSHPFSRRFKPPCDEPEEEKPVAQN